MNHAAQSLIRFLFLLSSGRITREQLRAIEYLQTECAVLRELLGKRRLRLNDGQRRRLAVKAKMLGGSRLAGLATIVSPDTILRWQRLLFVQKWDFSAKRKSPGRSAIGQAIAKLTLKTGRENPMRGYVRLQSALANVGHQVPPNTVMGIMRADYSVFRRVDRQLCLCTVRR